MSELVGLCFDANASPSIRFAAPQPAEVEAPPSGHAPALYGWGVGWYPSSERGASVLKDPTSSGGGRVSEALGGWRRFRSTVFVGHLRGHRRPRNQEDAQPFVRSYGGRQWIFAHDGDLAPDWQTRLPLPDDPAFDPLGGTDSEHAFCLLLARLHASRLRSLADASPETLREWLREINAGGQLNVLLTDGDHVVAYRDADGRGQLHWTRRLPPHATTTLGRPSVEIALDAPEDPSRTVLIFSSLPLGDGPWQALSPGELIVVRRGSVLWTSAPERSVPAAAPVAAGPFLANGPVNDSSWSETSHQAAAAQALMPEPIAPALESGLPPVPVRRKPSAAESATRRMQVFHETVYRYQEPVERSSHRLLLRPVEDRHQTLLEHSLEIQPAVVRPEFEDVFGNAATALEIRDPYQQLSIRSQSTVLLHGLRSLEQRAAHRRHGIPLVWMPWQRQMLSAYLLPPELPETQLQELSEFAMSFVERNDYDLVGTVLDLNERIYRDFEYVSGSTTVATTAFEVYQSRRGVCQDFANLMICLARLLHIPARYRMGYIYTGANYENQIQSDASHAWVELYLPQVGWHGLDPTNGIQVGLDHVRVACGRNYRDATPTSGTIYKGGGMETLEIRVQVQDLDDGDFAGSA